MIETEIAITVNRKSDLELIQQKVIEHKIRFPVYISEYESSYQIDFKSDYEEWELDTAILTCFPDYEYIQSQTGRKEIRIQISRYQSEYSTDRWGRQIDGPVNETKYLVKRSASKPVEFNPKIKVLFDDKEQYYFVNIINGVNEATQEKGFLILTDFKTENRNDDAEFLKDRLYKSPAEAFHAGCEKMRGLVNTDFNLFIEQKKKKKREIEKLPRKIIRDFINACNSSNEDGILKNVMENIIFERRMNWKTTFRAEGIPEFKKYLNSSDQQMSERNLRIRSSWNFALPQVAIGVDYSPVAVDDNVRYNRKYERIIFTFEGDKISSVIVEV